MPATGARVVIPLLLLFGAAACAGYRSGSYARLSGPFVGERLRMDCLDVAVRSIARRPGAEVIGITFGNRCDRGVWIDLAAVRVSAHHRDGTVLALTAFDPEGTIRPGVVDGRATGEEIIEYQGPESGEEPQWLCVDVSGIEVEARASPPTAACLDVSGGAALVAAP